MPFTPAYIFTILLGMWVLSLLGCIVLGIFCYRLVVERRRLRARLEQVGVLLAGPRPGDFDANNDLLARSLHTLPSETNSDPDTIS